MAREATLHPASSMRAEAAAATSAVRHEIACRFHASTGVALDHQPCAGGCAASILGRPRRRRRRSSPTPAASSGRAARLRRRALPTSRILMAQPQHDHAKPMAWYTFLACLFVLVMLRSPKIATSPHLYARIAVLGVCLGSLSLHLTASVALGITATIVVWSPLPFLMWTKWRRGSSAPAQSFQPKRREPMMCQPCR